MPFQIEFEDPRIGFASAHFIIGHDKCGKLHGHNYFLKVILANDLDEKNMVIDYGELKEQLRKITKPLDHHVLIPKKAQSLIINEKSETIEIITCNKRYLFPKEDIIFLPIHATTSEKLAEYFYYEIKKIWPTFHLKVTIEESPGASSTFSD